MSMDLKKLLEDVILKSGIQQKLDIQTVAQSLTNAVPNLDHPNGDDAAAIASPQGYDLLAGEGFMPEFVNADPWFAGWCGVMVNVSDIVAMGGRPSAITNTIWGQEGDLVDSIFEGMTAASQVFNVPIVGGHTNFRSHTTQLAVSIFGKANVLLSSFAAKPGHALIAAIDLRGSFRRPFLNWNAATNAPSQRLRADIELLPMIAEKKLAHAAKDISQAGLLGTCLMLLESSDVGAEIDLTKIPKPDDVDWLDWLCCFPSYGYLLTTPMNKLDELLATFDVRDINVAHIGNITEDKLMLISHNKQKELFWDIGKHSVTGMTMDTNPQTQPTTELGEVAHA